MYLFYNNDKKIILVIIVKFNLSWSTQIDKKCTTVSTSRILLTYLLHMIGWLGNSELKI